MSALHYGMESWLLAERQQMAQPTVPTAFLSNKAAMLEAIQFDPIDPRNTGATKARSHIDQCGMLLNQIETFDLEPLDRFMKLGDLAAKALKVASGYAMRAGYFHPTQPEELYRDRVVRLVDESGNSLPILGVSIAQLEYTALNRSQMNDVKNISDANLLFSQGQACASEADEKLRELLLAERARNEAFSGSIETQRTADNLTIAARGLFVALSAGAIRLQQDGPDSLGPIILEPKSDANANYYLRIEDLQTSIVNEVTQVSSRDAISRTKHNLQTRNH